MKKYMKGQYEYFGIAAPERAEIFLKHFEISGFPDKDNIDNIVKLCWEKPEREYQYFAYEVLLRAIKKIKYHNIELTEYLIINKSWWDTVDGLSANIAGEYFKLNKNQINHITGRWINSDNIWLKRSALLFQLKYKKNTNTELLEEYINKCKGSTEFFIRKAIGWVLREYSKTDPLFVENFVNKTELSGLSRTEALKIIRKKKNV